MVRLTEDEICIEGCVYKLRYGQKYVIIKAQTLYGSVTTINRDFEAFQKFKFKDFSGRNSFYLKFFTYVQDNPGPKAKVEVILETNNAYQLLKREEMELDKAIRDSNCLNNNVHAYIPKFRGEKYGWIKPTWVLNYKRFIKRM